MEIDKTNGYSKLGHPIEDGARSQTDGGNSIQNLSPPIFKLNLDCCDEIFTLLSLEDIHSICETCKALQQVAGFYYQQNYETLKVWIIYSAFRLGRLQLNRFSPFIENICIDDPIENIQFAGQMCSSNIKKICFDVVHITESKISCIKRILSKVEAVMISECTIDQDVYEILLKFCPNLKRLSVVFYEGFQNQWLHRKYATLENLKLAGKVTFRFHDVKQFFENNPNCKNFWIDGRYLMENRHSLMESRIKWCNLTISMATTYANNLNHFLVLFEELYACNVYERLHLFLNGKEWNRNFFVQLSSLPALTNLCLEYFEDFYVEHLSQLNKLEIYMPINISTEKLENMAKSLIKLEHLVFREASTNDILPFIRHSRRLNGIRVLTLKNGIFFSKGCLDVSKLNHEREKLIKAHKVILYVDEKVFLTTRWSTHEINFKMIEIRRLSAYQDSTYYATYI